MAAYIRSCLTQQHGGSDGVALVWRVGFGSRQYHSSTTYIRLNPTTALASPG